MNHLARSMQISDRTNIQLDRTMIQTKVAFEWIYIQIAFQWIIYTPVWIAIRAKGENSSTDADLQDYPKNSQLISYSILCFKFLHQPVNFATTALNL